MSGTVTLTASHFTHGHEHFLGHKTENHSFFISAMVQLYNDTVLAAVIFNHFVVIFFDSAKFVMQDMKLLFSCCSLDGV